MKKGFVFLLFFAVLLSTGIGFANEDQKLKIAVVDFTNKSNLRSYNIEEASNEILSTLLYQTGRFDVVERTQLFSIIQEQGLSASGLTDSTQSSVQIGKLLGVDYLATGSILSFNENVSHFRGYGIESQTIVQEMSVNVKILNVSTAKIEFSAIFLAQNKILNTSSTRNTSIGEERALLEKALNLAITDLVAYLDSKKPAAVQKVKVSFVSVPEGADVEIDNVFYGNTPLQIEIIPGLHPVKVSLAGYEEWSKTVNAYDGLDVKVTLGKKK